MNLSWAFGWRKIQINRGFTLFLSKLARRVAFDHLAGEFILEIFLHMETVFKVLMARYLLLR